MLAFQLIFSSIGLTYAKGLFSIRITFYNKKYRNCIAIDRNIYLFVFYINENALFDNSLYVGSILLDSFFFGYCYDNNIGIEK